MSFQIATVLWLLPAACALVVAAVGARIGLQIYRQEEAILQLERLDACFRTRVAGPNWMLRETAVTDSGIAELKRALPDLRVAL